MKKTIGILGAIAIAVAVFFNTQIETENNLQVSDLLKISKVAAQSEGGNTPSFFPYQSECSVTYVTYDPYKEEYVEAQAYGEGVTCSSGSYYCLYYCEAIIP